MAGKTLHRSKPTDRCELWTSNLHVSLRTVALYDYNNLYVFDHPDNRRAVFRVFVEVLHYYRTRNCVRKSIIGVVWSRNSLGTKLPLSCEFYQQRKLLERFRDYYVSK